MDIKIFNQWTRDGIHQILFLAQGSSAEPVSINDFISTLHLTDSHPFLLIFLEEDGKKRQMLEAGDVSTLHRFLFAKSPVREQNYARRLEKQELITIDLYDEDEWLWLFSQMPPDELPSWSELITMYDSISVNRVDEFLKVRTTNEAIIQRLSQFPILER